MTTESTVWNWGHGREPELRHMPAVITFLGYVTWEDPDDPVGRLAHFKTVNGLSFKRLAKLMRRDPRNSWRTGYVEDIYLAREIFGKLRSS
jgi:hypothetical protein